MSLVLGYGALLCPTHCRELCGSSHLLAFRKGTLRGYRRHWDLRYRNGSHPSEAYFEADAPSPFAGGVAFLGVREDADSALQVSELEVDAIGLQRVDDEEYLYRRIDVRHLYEPDESRSIDEPVWLYLDVPHEFPKGWHRGDDCVVTTDYHRRVTDAARRLTPDDPEHFERSTDPCPWPLRELVWRPLDGPSA